MIWKTGEKKIVYESQLFDINVTKVSVKRITCFQSNVDQFRVGLNLKEGREEQLFLTDYNVSVLRD